jgi:DNA-directed RNA polymerase specialized sigma24 family protein
VRIFLWRSNSWISRKSFPTWLRRIVAAEWRNPCTVISPTPRALRAARSRKLNVRLENGAPEYPANKLRSREGDPPGSQDAAAFKALLDGLPVEERLA